MANNIDGQLKAFFDSFSKIKAVILLNGEIIYPEKEMQKREIDNMIVKGTSIPNQYFYNGTWYEKETQEIPGIGLVTIFYDITNTKVMSETDLTTGLPIKRALVTGVINHLKDLIKNINSMEKGFSFIMADIDSFRDINNQHGHGCGDIILNRVAQILAQRSRVVSNPDYQRRPTDIVGRFGGEEFTIFWKDITKQNSFEKLDSIISEINKTRILYGSTEIECPTVSFGLYYVSKEELKKLIDSLDYLPEDEMLKELWNVLVHISDEVLYVSKCTGKNKFTFTDDFEENLLSGLSDDQKLEYRRNQNV